MTRRRVPDVSSRAVFSVKQSFGWFSLLLTYFCYSGISRHLYPRTVLSQLATISMYENYLRNENISSTLVTSRLSCFAHCLEQKRSSCT